LKTSVPKLYRSKRRHSVLRRSPPPRRPLGRTGPRPTAGCRFARSANSWLAVNAGRVSQSRPPNAGSMLKHPGTPTTTSMGRSLLFGSYINRTPRRRIQRPHGRAAAGPWTSGPDSLLLKVSCLIGQTSGRSPRPCDPWKRLIPKPPIRNQLDLSTEIA